MTSPRARAHRHAAAFTLIEILAVAAIMALAAAVVLPNFGTLAGRNLRADAERLRAKLELARQRAVVTAQPHQVVLDLDDGSYRLEVEKRSEAPAPPGPPAPGSRVPVSLAPPPQAELAFAELPGVSGRSTWLAERVFFGGVETEGGFSERGRVAISFDADGATSPAEILLEDEGGGSLVLLVRPLADAVRIVGADAA